MRLVLCLPLALAAASALATEVVYRSTAPDGTLIYSDRPVSADATPITVATTREGSRMVLPSAPPASPAAPLPGGAPEAREPTAAEQNAERERNCAAARERVERYASANRLYRTLADGEREYLDAAEIDEVRARAAADVETWCG